MDPTAPLFAPDEDFSDYFSEHGFAALRQLLDPAEIGRYREICDRFFTNQIDTGIHRSDLGNHIAARKPGIENVTQIMWPSHHLPELHELPLHRRCLDLARRLLGPDVAFDFDMLIDKAPETRTATPWHQDAAYWPDLPDKRAVSFWVALDHATRDNGCMWFVPGSHRQPIRTHRSAGAGAEVLECDAHEDEAVAVEVKPGSCTVHHGHTLHYTRGNSTPTHRRAFILNYRPQAMIALERAKGFDHGLKANVRQLRNTAAQS